MLKALTCTIIRNREHSWDIQITWFDSTWIEIYRLELSSGAQFVDFEIISEISDIETFARGLGVRIRNYLNHQHAGGRRMRWAHRKGVALVRYLNGEIWLAEVHWFEANGIGRRDETVKYRIRRIG